MLAHYSERMKKLIEDPEAFYKPAKRPSGHDISAGFGKDNGGAIPSNMLSIPNTDSNSPYLRLCKEFELDRHPARFPTQVTTNGDTPLFSKASNGAPPLFSKGVVVFPV